MIEMEFNLTSILALCVLVGLQLHNLEVICIKLQLFFLDLAVLTLTENFVTADEVDGTRVFDRLVVVLTQRLDFTQEAE